MDLRKRAKDLVANGLSYAVTKRAAREFSSYRTSNDVANIRRGRQWDNAPDRDGGGNITQAHKDRLMASFSKERVKKRNKRLYGG